MKRRVVVTGVGLVLPQGIGTDPVWEKICEGVSGVGPITKFDATGFETGIAAEVKDFRPEDFIEPREIKKMDTFIHYALAAARIALDHSGLEISAENCERIGVIVGAGLGGLTTLEKYHKVLLERGADVNLAGCFGMNALCVAANEGCLDIVRVLLAQGPDVSVRDNRGYTALKRAEKRGHTEIAELLKETGARQ